MVTNNNRGLNRDRAGNYVSQINGYKAFVPKPLPPNPLSSFGRTCLSTAGILVPEAYYYDAIPKVVVRRFGACEIAPQGQEVESAVTS